MSENKTFKIALLVSVAAHSVFFLGLPHMPFVPSKRLLRDVKIAYYKIKEAPKVKKQVEPIVRKLPDIKKEEISSPPKKIAVKKKQAVQKKPKQVAAHKKAKAKEKRFEKVIEEEKDDAKKATYISYYRSVREKIRQYADRNYPREKRLIKGEVFLSFVVASSGELLLVKVVDERSAQSPALRKIAINSVRDASPFPAFPKGMSQYQITFNVIISFESR
ncbi:energy transducer TonB [Candidatus Omnitrophota bacterium]